MLKANGRDPDQTPRYAASDLGLHCLPIAHRKDARLKKIFGFSWAVTITGNGTNNVVYAISKGSYQNARTHRLIRAFASRLTIL